MTGSGPTSSPEQTRPPEDPGSGTAAASGAAGAQGVPPAASSAVVRAAKLNAGNMARSLVPLLLICLALAGWVALRQTPDDPVTEVDPSSSVRLAAERADYPLLAPSGLPDGFRPTSARTDAGAATEGDPVALEIGYFTPGREFAGFVIGDDPRVPALATVLDGAEKRGTVRIGGRTWTRETTERGETAFVRTADGATVLVTGSADDAELTEVAAAVGPYTG